MSELSNVQQDRNAFFRKLLSTVSMLALLGWVGGRTQIAEASDEDSTHPNVWIELGGQFERVDSTTEPFSPPVLGFIPPNTFTSPVSAQRLPMYSIGGEGEISFSPDRSNWAFTASVRYGRSSGLKAIHQQTTPPTLSGYRSFPALHLRFINKFSPIAEKFLSVDSYRSQTHTIVDFSAGRDVGLGIFGSNSSSMINFGIRFAQFGSQTKTNIAVNPDFRSQRYHSDFYLGALLVHESVVSDRWHNAHGIAYRTSSFRGAGPSLAWESSFSVLGSQDRESVSIDWGIDAALLFGRQKVKARHQTSGLYVCQYYSFCPHHGTRYTNPEVAVARGRTVVVPNVGGFAGLSLEFPNAKLSLGYRADFFLHAADGGMDERKTYDRNFYGPFATVSIGIGR